MNSAVVHPQEGRFYWGDTARSNIESLFSDKSRRPVLVTAVIGSYAAVYPCTRYRNGLRLSEWAGDVFGYGETYVVTGYGLFYIPILDLNAPEAEWEEWPVWKRAHRQALNADLAAFRKRHGALLTEPPVGVSGRPTEPLMDSIENRLPPEIRRRLTAPPEPVAPIPPPLPARRPERAIPPPKPPTPDELFQQAIDEIPPYHILKHEPDSEPRPPQFRNRKSKRR